MAVRKVRIQSDGEGFCGDHSSTIDVESGKQIPDVVAVDIHMSPDGPEISAVITVNQPQVDVIADASIVERCPHCGRTTKEE